MWVWKRKLYKNGCTNIISLIKRGLKQGDPLAPFLFLLATEWLDSLMKVAVEFLFLKGFKAWGMILYLELNLVLGIFKQWRRFLDGLSWSLVWKWTSPKVVFWHQILIHEFGGNRFTMQSEVSPFSLS